MHVPARSALVLCLAAPALLAMGPLEGVTQPYRQVELAAAVSGLLVDVKVHVGQAVKAGQPLAQLYAKLEELEMQRTKVLLDRREYEHKGANKLFDSKIIPENKAMETRAELELARLAYERAVEQVRLRTLAAPFDGRITERYRDVGESVSSAQPIFRILDLSRLYVVCQVRPERAIRLAVGQKATVHLPQADPGTAHPAEVAVVDAQADAAGLYRVKLVMDNPDGRIPAGFRAVVDFNGG